MWFRALDREVLGVGFRDLLISIGCLGLRGLGCKV